MRWLLFTPEIYVLLVAFWFLAKSMGGKPDAGGNHRMAMILAVVGVGVTLAAINARGLLFADAYRVDLFSQVFKVMLSLGLLFIVSICGELGDIRDGNRRDFYALLFLCTLAMMLLVSSEHLLTLYVSLELSSYSLYVLVALRRDQGKGLEAGLKYFLVGVFASAVMIFGIALLYAMTQAVTIGELAQALPGAMDRPAVAIGLLLTLSGFFFKLAVFPFHFWVPDVYQGASNEVAAYIATASKVAAVAVLLRVVASTGGGGTPYLVHVLMLLSIVSMTVGNLAAITQQDMKRLLGYSTVAHAGYVLIGVLSMNGTGYSATVFYALALLLMKFTAFLVVIVVASDGRDLQIEQLAGLHRRSPILALALMVSLFSLAGIPPTIGFTGKFLIFVAAIEQGHLALVLIAMINVVISLYYYLLIIKAAYLTEPKEDLPELRESRPVRWLATGLVALMIVLGFYPWHLIQLAQAAVRGLM